MAEERKGAVTMRGNPMTLVGPEIKVGQKAPNFNVVGKGMAPATLDQFKGKVKIITTIPSIDTPVCDAFSSPIICMTTLCSSSGSAISGSRVSYLSLAAAQFTPCIFPS